MLSKVPRGAVPSAGMLVLELVVLDLVASVTVVRRLAGSAAVCRDAALG